MYLACNGYDILFFSLTFYMMQKTFSFTVRDSLINVGPLKDFSYGLRMNADPNATGVAKQSNYELVSYLLLGSTYISFFMLVVFFW